MTVKMPNTIYFAVVGSPRHPEGYFAGDYYTDLDMAIDEAVDAFTKDGQPFRIFRADFDVETNMPEAFRDITEDAIADRNAFLTANGREAIAA